MLCLFILIKVELASNYVTTHECVSTTYNICEILTISFPMCMGIMAKKKIMKKISNFLLYDAK